MLAAKSEAQERYERLDKPTVAYAWFALAGAPITDELLEWPPDVFALTNSILERTEAFRFALSPLGEWPPSRHVSWAESVVKAAREWSVWVENRDGPVPEVVAEEWNTFRDRVELPLEHVAQGLDWRMCEALLTLHAIADEACAGLGVALDTFDAEASVYRAQGRELLARTGSLARVEPGFFRVLPKVVTPPTGRATFSRYACVQRPGIEVRWRKLPTRHRGTGLGSEHARMLLLPWPLQVREADFHPLEDSVQRPTKEPFGFFEYAPDEGLDLDLLDRVLVTARAEAGSVDVVVMPESAVDESEIDALEGVLDRHGVAFLQTGVRGRPREPGRYGSNWLHIAVNANLEKGGLPDSYGGAWFHIRQNKHHRWSLDESQIYQYHLGGALHPHIRWWEAMEVPRLAVEFVEVAELTLVSLVCEDLAWDDEVADLIRAVGPTTVATVLFDGPQLTSRWSARYASVLADDPGSAVLCLTSYGMVQRSRPHGREASSIVALYKDPAQGVREIPLETGAHGVLLTVCMDRATRRSADGRWPVDNGTQAFDAAVHQIRAATVGSGPVGSRPPKKTRHELDPEELTILTAWAEAVAEAAAFAPERAATILDAAKSGAVWRPRLGLVEPTGHLSDAIDATERIVKAVTDSAVPATLDALLAATGEDRTNETALETLVRRVLLSILEERRTRQPDSSP